MLYLNLPKISLYKHPTLTEEWVQSVIKENPSILGLGNVVVKDKERVQPKAGRLDLLLQDEDSNQRYEVEVQLGRVDESHIIRTLEYWDLERKRYPLYEHCAVIIAEDITTRFLNVINLFNGFIPLIAIQVGAYQISENNVTLIFTKIYDKLDFGDVTEEEEGKEPTDRNYWETEKSDRATVALADEVLELTREFAPGHNLKYNKFYIGLEQDRQANNFISFRPKKKSFRLEIKLPYSQETDLKLTDAGLDVMDYDSRWKRFRIKLSKNEIQKNKDLLIDLMKEAFGQS